MIMMILRGMEIIVNISNIGVIKITNLSLRDKFRSKNNNKIKNKQINRIYTIMKINIKIINKTFNYNIKIK